MLDSETKRRIDYLRDILVGKIPSPQSQIEQITTGLIYKFMYDMDVEAVEMGGVPSFFVGDYEKYSWKHLFDPTLGGADKVQLYSDAIENMYNNPTAPPLFREIFKNSFLPFKDPSTLNMFLREINEFHYSHSEKLGDAFEYLLSFMGSQGDAGQFRTPRHIIDFIVEIVNPQKNETILDPACGTAGFLISSYKHILSQNTDKKLGDKLNASDRKQVGDNLVGYDISPDMTRISLVNMYLHQFASPQIHEYDTLSSEDRWNEYYDVILANPPFFSPTGGIQPHSRFGVQSTRAEVLFVDYIMEHLKPTGRAGIVVPEGIIFQTGTAYKTLRKKLVEDCLVGVISLPAGVFQPYSGVKTSILILDKELNQKSDNIFFAKIENDGFSLGAQRTSIGKNDLPDVIKLINERDLTDERFIEVNKSKVLSSSDISFSYSKYIETFTSNFSNFDLVKLGDLVEIQSGAREKGGAKTIGIPSIGGGQIDSNGRIKSEKMVYISEDFFEGLNKGKLKDGDILIVKDGATTGKVGLFQQEYEKASINEHVFLLRCNQNIINKFLFYLLKTPIFKKILAPYIQGIIGGINLSIKEIEIPLPPINVQQQIVDELEGYQKIIDGCRQVIENYKPTIDIDPSWEMVELSEVCEMVKRGITPSYTKDDGIIVVNQKCIRNHQVNLSESRKHDITNKKISDEKLVKYGDVLVNSTGVGTLGRVAQFLDKSISEITVDSHVTIVRPKTNNFEVEFFGYMMIGIENQIVKSGRGSSGQTELSRNELIQMKVCYPTDRNIQRSIIQSMREENLILEGNKRLIGIYTQKIQDRIGKVWGE